tara:strand:- start:298 stop:489 length:192 start_codon:yes stop_codon:yes gene_type:complete
MTIGEIINDLKTTKNYFDTRLKYDDNTLDFIKTTFQSDYTSIKEKEEAFVEVRKALSNGNIFN